MLVKITPMPILGRMNTTLPIAVKVAPGPPPPNKCVDVVQTFQILVPSSSATLTFPITTVTTRRDCQQGIKVTVNPGNTYTLGIVN